MFNLNELPGQSLTEQEFEELYGFTREEYVAIPDLYNVIDLNGNAVYDGSVEECEQWISKKNNPKDYSIQE